jgi:hypothetical protein
MKSMSRKKAEEFINSQVLGSSEVQEILMVNKSRLAVLITTGKLIPIKELKREHLFYLPDVLACRDELMKDPRANVAKSKKAIERSDIHNAWNNGDYLIEGTIENVQ